MWSDGLESCRRPTGEVSVCAGRLREESVSGTTDSLRQTAAEAAVSTHSVGTGHRTAVLRATRRQDTNRHSDP